MNTFTALLSADSTADEYDPVALLITAGVILGILVLAFIVTRLIARNAAARQKRVATSIQETVSTSADLSDGNVLIAILSAAVAASQATTSGAKFRVVSFRRLH